MARVVQRRTSPPYLLIVFVFLFLIATTVAVLMYLGKDEATKSNKDMEPRLAAVDKANRQAKQDIEKLSEAITGVKSESPENALASVDALKTKVKEKVTTSSLVAAINALLDQQAALQTQVTDLLTQKSQALTEKNTVATSLTEEQKKFEEYGKSFQDNFNKLTVQNTTFDSAKKAELDKIRQEDQRIVDEKDKRINALNSRIVSLEQANQKLQGEYDNLLLDFRKVRIEGMDLAKDVRKPKGMVSQVLEMQKILYIDRGSNDKITPGLTFSVYPSSGIPEDGKGKAAILVSNVSPNVSECRIATSTPGNPILAGDVIGNVVYDPTRTFTFVVKGNFDLHQSGRATYEGAQEVKSLIRRAGGKLSDDVGADTDFIVIGEEPAQPAKLSDEATAQDQKIFQEQMKAYTDYKQTEKEAARLHVLPLNANRFMALIGYNPTKVQ